MSQIFLLFLKILTYKIVDLKKMKFVLIEF